MSLLLLEALLVLELTAEQRLICVDCEWSMLK